jgi:hypothetical protein
MEQIVALTKLLLIIIDINLSRRIRVSFPSNVDPS